MNKSLKYMATGSVLAALLTSSYAVASTGNSVLLKDEDTTDTGEIRLNLDSADSAGALSVNVMVSSDETQTAYIGIYGESGVSTAYKMAELKLDEGYADSSGSYVGVRLRSDATYDAATLTDIAADTWTNFALSWDRDLGTYDLTIDGLSYGSYDLILNDEDVAYVVFKLSSNAGTSVADSPVYFDDFTVYSDTDATTVVFSDDFDDYDVGYVLGSGTDSADDYHSNTYGATISDAEDATNASDDEEENNTETEEETTEFWEEDDAAPSDFFDLTDWYLSVPTDTDNSGTADSIKESKLSAGYESEYFYAGEDGAMVFVCTVGGYKTSTNTTYTRTELREMLRRGDTSISTSYDPEDEPEGNGRLNNWAFSSIDYDDYDEFGGINGIMKATLAVNKVTTTSSSTKQVGRTIIGQIHADDNEPIRLYYHKLPGNENGAIYFAHETSKEGLDADHEYWFNLLGNMIQDGDENIEYADGYEGGDIVDTSNPVDGIALDEQFSYTIEVDGHVLMVSITQDDELLAYKEFYMVNSGYDDPEDYMYFKAGIYLNDKTSDEDDYAKVSFYELSNDHEDYEDESELMD